MAGKFAELDTRKYPMVSAREGYAEWAASYDKALLDEMDIRLLERLSVDWPRKASAIDLACGTGRIGQWLVLRGVAAVDGVDITEEMMAKAREKEVYRTLKIADVRETGLAGGSYDLAIQSLACEHLVSLEPLYWEAARITNAQGVFVIDGYHPCFMLRGVPTHFDRKNGEPLAIETHLHLLSDHVAAATKAGFRLEQLEERVVDDEFIAYKASWERHRHWPISFAAVWVKG